MNQARLELSKARRKAHDEAIAAPAGGAARLAETKLALRAQTDRLRAQSGEPPSATAIKTRRREYQRAQRRFDQLSQEIASAAPPRRQPVPRPSADRGRSGIGAKVYGAAP